ncbi:MAG: hypothetical protein JWL84_3119 [Rhodospirillales bacterium]|nr:hypothetical protein [Rhodospirillales bacterium]
MPLYRATSIIRRQGSLIVAATLLALLSGCLARPPQPPGAAQCLAELNSAGVGFEPIVVPVAANGCGIANAVRVRSVGAGLDQPVVASCGLAAALARFEREAVQPAALRHFGQRVTVLRHFGSYDCRRESTGRDRLSQHAHGNAIDLAGFQLADGSSVTVKADWQRPGPRRDFLRELARRACSYFSVVLTPARDATHHDHLHLDVGPYRLCGG